MSTTNSRIPYTDKGKKQCAAKNNCSGEGVCEIWYKLILN